MKLVVGLDFYGWQVLPVHSADSISLFFNTEATIEIHRRASLTAPPPPPPRSPPLPVPRSVLPYLKAAANCQTDPQAVSTARKFPICSLPLFLPVSWVELSSPPAVATGARIFLEVSVPLVAPTATHGHRWQQFALVVIVSVAHRGGICCKP